MPTLASSQVTPLIPVGKNTILTVTPASGATVKVEYTKGSEADIKNGVAVWSVLYSNQIIFNDNSFVRITATGGSVDYTVDLNPSQKSIDAFTQDTGRLMSNSISTAVIAGDSITAQNRADTSTFLKYSDRGYFVWADSFLGQRLELLNNAGINGNTSTQLLARLDVDVLAYNAGWNFVLIGVNDILTGVPWQTTVSNLQAIYGKIIANGGNVVAMAVLPCGSFSTATMQTALVNINLWIKNYAVRNPKVWFVDSYTPLVDPTSATGAPVTSYMWDSTTHPSTSGAQLIGKAIFNVLDSVIPKINIQSSLADAVSATNPYGNFVLNPLMAGTAGTNEAGSSGSQADNWRSIITAGTATAVGAKVARTDYPNLTWQQETITSTSGSSTYWLYAFGKTLAGSGINAGDLVYAQFELDLSFTGVTLSDLKPYLVSTTGTGILTAYANGQNDGSIRNDGPYIFRTPNFTIPLDATGSPRPVIELVFSGTGSLVLKAGRVELRKVN